VVLNDDLRDEETDAHRLQALGFRFVRVATQETIRLQRLHDRNDLSVIQDSPLDCQIARIPADYVICNSSHGFEALDGQVNNLVQHLFKTLRTEITRV